MPWITKPLTYLSKYLIGYLNSVQDEEQGQDFKPHVQEQYQDFVAQTQGQDQGQYQVLVSFSHCFR